MTTTLEMTKALKEHFVPVLRAAGFKGSFPNFYRDVDGFISLVNFQFNRMGEAFCINLGFADPARRNVIKAYQDIAPKKMRVSMTGGLIEQGNYVSGQWRVGSKPIGDGLVSDSWFVFAPGEYGADRSVATVDPVQLARTCVALFETEAEPWWAGRRAFAAASTQG